MSSAVIGVPTQDAGHGGVHPGRHHEGHAILDLGMFDADGGDHGIADDGWKQREEHENTTEFQAIGENGDHDCDD